MHLLTRILIAIASFAAGYFIGKYESELCDKLAFGYRWFRFQFR